MSEYPTATPRIACHLLVKKDGTFAFVKRANTGWRDGYYGLPGGRVEKNESYISAAVREAKEELGIIIQPLDLRHVLTTHRNEDDTDWIDLVFTAAAYSGEAYNAEPHIHSELAWFDLHDLPNDVHPSLRFMLDEYLDGKTYTEYGWSS